ncbi:MAG TPA: YciI family protein, partial [Gaiellaceae bacterium]|nr:YciI family protein [Gaiellaceae bacterium]
HDDAQDSRSRCRPNAPALPGGTAQPGQSMIGRAGDSAWLSRFLSAVRDGKTLTTDGPFVAVKEALGGYLVFEADDLDAAIELAARIPQVSRGGAIEVRPAMEG